jgi:hypothetical protein
LVQSPAVCVVVGGVVGTLVGTALGDAVADGADVSVGLGVGPATGPQAVRSRTAPIAATRGSRFTMDTDYWGLTTRVSRCPYSEFGDIDRIGGRSAERELQCCV